MTEVLSNLKIPVTLPVPPKTLRSMSHLYFPSTFEIQCVDIFKLHVDFPTTFERQQIFQQNFK